MAGREHGYTESDFVAYPPKLYHATEQIPDWVRGPSASRPIGWLIGALAEPLSR